MSYEPTEQYIIYDGNGNKHVINTESVIDESDEDDMGAKKSCVINGKKYSAFSLREIYYRDEQGQQQELGAKQTYHDYETYDRPFDEDGEIDIFALTSEDGFNDVDGFAEHIYAVGGKGDVWRYVKGTWTRCGFPSNIDLERVCCGGDGNVYVSGVEGMTFVGKEDSWTALKNPQLSLPFEDMVWYDNKKNEEVFATDYDGAVDFSEELAGVSIDGKWGYIDTTGKQVIPSNTDKPTMGRGLRDAYRTALSMSGIEMTDVHLRLGDVTGEEYFFQESITGYGSVLEGVMPKGYEALVISSYLGDVRSVSGIFGIAYVWQLAQKGQFNEKFALVHMSSPSHSKRTVVALKTEVSRNLPLPVSKTILPVVVEQHISEASMYLRQQDAIWHPVMKYQDILRFKKLMLNHLEGIVTSGIDGFKLALKQLNQWKTSDETFVSLYSYLNLNIQNPSDIEIIESLISKDISLNTAASAALMYVENDFTIEFALNWWHNGTPTQKNAALLFVLKQSQNDEKVIKEALSSTFAPIRRQVIKHIGANRYINFEPEIYNALKDDDKLCRIEAACSLALFNNSKSMSLFNGKELLAIPLPMRNFMIWSYTVEETLFQKWLDYAKETDSIWPLLWSIFFRSENQYINEVLNIL